MKFALKPDPCKKSKGPALGKEENANQRPRPWVCVFGPPSGIRQNEYFKENWMNRGLPTVELIFASELGFSTSVAGGLANEGWLATLRNSARNRTLWVSAMRMVLPIDKSMFA